ncbi:MAG: hypothetical protein KC486_29735, partial [Myxococcales bacterium]|nr:hypothetical protein [Myxococcales bacterium]
MRWLRGVADLPRWLPVAVALVACGKPPMASERPAADEVAVKGAALTEAEDERALAEDDASAEHGENNEGSEFLAEAAEGALEGGAGEVAAEDVLPAEDVVVLDPGAPKIERPEALEGFFAALANTRRDGVARVLHMGDSSIGMDGLPHAIRRRMQDHFGDAGPGFVLVDRFSKNYTSNVAKIEA